MKLIIDYPDEAIDCSHAYQYSFSHCMKCGVHRHLTQIYHEQMNGDGSNEK